MTEDERKQIDFPILVAYKILDVPEKLFPQSLFE